MKSVNKAQPKQASTSSNWTFLTNHLHVILCLHREKQTTVRNLAVCIGVTERSVQRILNELVDSEVITRERDGRRNIYKIDYTYRLRHKLERNHSIGELLELLRE
ncbi:MAG: winged helix-turn-helix domain-containing protein [Rubritalea sp.]|jgi:predicted transcriptional regulator